VDSRTQNQRVRWHQLNPVVCLDFTRRWPPGNGARFWRRLTQQTI